MKADLGIPVKKVEEFAKVFEENEVYTKKGLFMLSEEQVKAIAQKCNMGIPSQQSLIKIWRVGRAKEMLNEGLEGLPEGEQLQRLPGGQAD